MYAVNLLKQSTILLICDPDFIPVNQMSYANNVVKKIRKNKCDKASAILLVLAIQIF